MEGKETPPNAEGRWIRLQEVGLVLLLSIPAFLAVIIFIRGDTMWGLGAQTFLNFYTLGSVVVGTAGIVCLQYGKDKRRELLRQDDPE